MACGMYICHVWLQYDITRMGDAKTHNMKVIIKSHTSACKENGKKKKEILENFRFFYTCYQVHAHAT